MPEDRFRVAVLDDYERFCASVPAYEEAARLADIRGDGAQAHHR